jgi:hypothetical protein
MVASNSQKVCCLIALGLSLIFPPLQLVAMDSLIRYEAFLRLTLYDFSIAHPLYCSSMGVKRALVLMGSNSRVDDCVRALQQMGHKTAALYQVRPGEGYGADKPT